MSVTKKDCMAAALTFDDGPSADITPRILELLSQYNASASFCVLGSCAAKYPEIIKQTADRGFEIVNHSWDHENFTKISDEEIKESILKTEDAIYSACGKHSAFVRPPYGAFNSRTSEVLRSLGKAQLLWNTDSLDWKTRDFIPIVSEVLARERHGKVILLHDIYKPTYEAMLAVVPFFCSRGFRMVTAGELLRMSGITVIPGESYCM